MNTANTGAPMDLHDSFAQLESFYRNICGTDGNVPDCYGCVFHGKRTGCKNSQHPMNLMLCGDTTKNYEEIIYDC